MKTVFAIIFAFQYLIISIIFSTKSVYADNIRIQCDDKFSNYIRSSTFSDQTALGQSFNVSVTFNSTADTSFNYSVKATQLSGTGVGDIRIGNFDIRSNQQKLNPLNPTLNFTMNSNNKDRIGIFKVSLMHSEKLGEEEVCELGTINFFDENFNKTICNLKMPNNIKQDEPFSFDLYKTDLSDIKQAIYFYRQNDLNIDLLPKGINYLEGDFGSTPIKKFVSSNWVYNSGELAQNPAGATGITIPYDNNGSNRLNGGYYIAIVEAKKYLGKTSPKLEMSGIPPSPTLKIQDRWFASYCSLHPFTVSTDSTSDPTDSNPITKPGTAGTLGGGDVKTEKCLDRVKKGDPTAECVEGGGLPIEGCTDNQNNPGIATAIGCIHTNPAEFVKDMMTWVIGIGGGLAFLMMLLGAFQMITSAGNPETLNAGKERITSAVIGLLFIIFAVLLLQIIGFDILKIPGFGR